MICSEQIPVGVRTRGLLSNLSELANLEHQEATNTEADNSKTNENSSEDPLQCDC